MTIDKKIKGTDVPRSVSMPPPPSLQNATSGTGSNAAVGNQLMDNNSNEVSSPGKARIASRPTTDSNGNNNNGPAKKSASKVSSKSVTLSLNSASPTLALLPSSQYQLSAPYYLPNQPTRPTVYNRMINPAVPTAPLPTTSPPSASARTAMVKSTIGFDRNRTIRTQVEKAIREHKIFACVGVYPAVRKALQKRGWVEKNPSLGIARSANLESVMRELESRGFTEESDQSWKNRVLRDYPPDLIWVIRRDNIDWRSLHKDQIVNRFPRAFFTTKVGIAACLQTVQWFSEAGVSDTFFPRCYRLCVDEERAAFIDDYRLTACMGLLKWVVSAYETDGEEGVMDTSSRVTSLAVDFAVRQVNNYVRMRRHEDIDWLMPPAFMGQHWDVFLSQYYNVVLLKCKLAPNDSQDTGKLKYEAAKRTLSRLAPYWPQLTIDGTKNIWICKPGARSRGKGIIIMNQLDKILELLAQSNHKEANWVVQKYIERPLIVYNTKFDIRQWFIVSDWNPLTVWFYKESYIRFCTKPFSLDDFHESIHLCNNAIQCRYQNSELRDNALPEENMWDCYTFQSYLKTQGKLDEWDTVIYPGMKQCIIGVLLASQETVDFRKNCFELYGADFMLSEDLRPWLIEINSCPCMAPSTSVTARMCAQCLEDAIKVIVDRRECKDADTGMFEMIYRQTQSTIPMPFNGLELVIQGKKLTKEVEFPKGVRSGQRQGSVSGGLTFTDLVQRLRLKDAQGTSGMHMSMGFVDNFTPRSISHVPAPFVAATLAPVAPGQLTSEDRINQNSIISVKKLDVQKHVTDHSRASAAAITSGSSTASLNNKYSNAETWTVLKREVRDSFTGSKTSLTSNSKGTGLRTRGSKNQKAASTSSSHQSSSNGEMLLSTLLQNSVSLQPTVADLARLAQRVHGGDQSMYEDLYNTRISKDHRGKKDGAGRTKSKSSHLSSQQTPTNASPGTPAIVAGTIRPNARTTMNAVPRSVEKQGHANPNGSNSKKHTGNSTAGSLKAGKTIISQRQLLRLISKPIATRKKDFDYDATTTQVEANQLVGNNGDNFVNTTAEDYSCSGNDFNSNSPTTRSSSRGSSSIDHVEIVIFLEPESGDFFSAGPDSPQVQTKSKC